MAKQSGVNVQFKILYALGIIFIVAGHSMNGGLSLAYEWFTPYAFHIGLFVFCSGYFYKEQSEEKPLAYIWKKCKHLIIPIYIWNVVYGILVWLLRFEGFTIGGDMNFWSLVVLPITNGHQFVYNLCGWYVIPLFMTEVCNVLLRKLLFFLKKGKEVILFFLYLCLGMFGIWLCIQGKNTGNWVVLARLLYFLPFYGAGTFYRKVLEKHDTLGNVTYLIMVFALQLWADTCWGRVVSYTPSLASGYNAGEGVFAPFLIGFIGIAFWLRIAKILVPVFEKSKMLFLVADNTFSIMLHQFAGFMLVKGVFACIKKYTAFCQDFDMVQFKTNIWYYYLPRGLSQWLIVYLIAGIVVPIGIALVVKKGKTVIFKKSK